MRQDEVPTPTPAPAVQVPPRAMATEITDMLTRQGMEESTSEGCLKIGYPPKNGSAQRKSRADESRELLDIFFLALAAKSRGWSGSVQRLVVGQACSFWFKQTPSNWNGKTSMGWESYWRWKPPMLDSCMEIVDLKDSVWENLGVLKESSEYPKIQTSRNEP